MDILHYKGQQIEVNFDYQADGRGHNFIYTKEGKRTRVIVLDDQSDCISDTVRINWIEETLKENGDIEKVNQYFHDFRNDGTYQKWYFYQVSGVGGVWIFSACLNGVLSVVFNDKNLYCKNPLQNWVFFQPVIFTVDATTTTATTNVSDGNGTIEFSINGIDWQSSNIFEGLEQGTEYTIESRTTEDLWISSITFFTDFDLII